MATLVPVDNNLYKGVTTATSVSATITGTGSNKLVVVVVRGRAGSVQTLTAMTLDGVSGTVHSTLNIDGGGVASFGGVAYFVDSENPGAGTFTIDTTWSGTPNDLVFEVYEYSGALQVSPLSAEATATDSAVVDGGTIDVTLASQSGELAIVYCSSADTVTAGAGGGHTVDADATLLDEDFNLRTRAGFANDLVVASASVTYTWTVSSDGTETIDNVVAGAFAVFAAAGPSLTGPDSGTQEATTQAAGSDLDTVTTFSLITTAGGFAKVQSDYSDSTFQYTAESGEAELRAAAFTPVAGCPMTATIAATGTTAWQVQQKADDGVDFDTRNITLNVASGFDVIQTMISEANTTPGESVLGTDIVGVEDNHQFVAPDNTDGATITWADDGTFTIDDNGIHTVEILYLSPSTKQWSKFELTMQTSSVIGVSSVYAPYTRLHVHR